MRAIGPTARRDRPGPRTAGPESFERCDRESESEPERRDQADELAPVPERLRHHRVGEHGEQRPTSEGEDERHRPVRGVVEARSRPARRRAEAAATRVHRPITLRPAHPAVTSPVVPATASGRLERKTATRIATLTLPPSTRVSPSTAVSGIPSRTVPSTIASPDPDRLLSARALAVLAAHPIDQASPTKKVSAPANRPSATPPAAAGRLEGLVDEVVGDGADQHPRSERHHQPEHAFGIGTLSAIKPPSTSEDPATTPQKNASPIRPQPQVTVARLLGERSQREGTAGHRGANYRAHVLARLFVSPDGEIQGP